MKKVLKAFKCEYLLFIIPIIILCVSNVSYDNDIWFILNHGRYVLENGIPYIEPFTIHEGLEFVMQQWLSALIFWIFYNFLGKSSIFIFMIMCGTIIVFVYYKLCKLLSNNKLFSIILAVLFSFTIRNYIVTRPQIFTYLILILEIYNLESYIKFNNKKNLYMLPAFSLLLINLHASMWFMQFLFLLPFIINGINFKKIKLGNYKLKPILFVILLMFIVGFINPYGYKSIIYVFNSYGLSYINNFIGEMNVLTFNNFNCKLLLCAVFFILFSFNFFKKRKVELRHLFLLFGTMILAFMHNKSLPYFFIVYFYILSYFFKDVRLFNIFKFVKNKYLKQFILFSKIGLYCMLVFTLFFTLITSFNNLKYGHVLEESADIILKDSNVNDISLYVGYNDGGYFEFRGIKSYIDPRAEVFVKKNNKKEDILKEHVKMDDEDFDFDEFVKKYNFTHFVVYPEENFDKYLLENNDRYELLYEQYYDEQLIMKVYKTINGE